MNSPDLSLNYSKKRFEWKKEVNKSSDLSQGTKLLATTICDTYVNRKTGMFWPKNETMAECLNKSVRSIQRHLRELEEAGWIERIHKKRVRRAYRICFPAGHEGDSKHDKEPHRKVTNKAREDDANVTPYKNQVYNQKNRSSSRMQSLPAIVVNETESGALDEWRSWISDNRNEALSETLEMLRNGSGYWLPCRYPKAEDGHRYHVFFDTFVSPNEQSPSK